MISAWDRALWLALTLAGLLLATMAHAAPPVATTDAQAPTLAEVVALLRQRDPAGAVKLAEQAALTAPVRETLIGVAMLMDQRALEARPHLESAVALDPESDASWLYLALAHYQLGELQQAHDALAKAGAAVDAVDAARLLSARLDWLTGDAAGAVATLEEWTELPGAPWPVWRELALIFADLGLPRGVVAVLERHPNAPTQDVSAILHNLSERVGPWHLIPVLDTVCAAWPQWHEPHLARAQALAAAGQHAAAARALDRLQGGDYAYEAADQHRLAGNFGSALRRNDRARAHPEATAQRFAILFEMSRCNAALRLVDKLEERGQLSPALALRAAVCALEAGRGERALRLLAPLGGTPLDDSAEPLRTRARGCTRELAPCI